MNNERFAVQWLDLRREATREPDPAYPDGRPIELLDKSVKFCTVVLEHPAPRCGLYIVACRECGLKVGITTAGRADDPKSAELPCNTEKTDA